VDPAQRRLAGRLKETLATFRKAEDLINIGAYVNGSNPKIDHAIQMIDRINAYLRQEVNEKVSFAESLSQLNALFGNA
jgi:flagellum-specific ATP synthase